MADTAYRTNCADNYENSAVRLTRQESCEDGTNKITLNVKQLRKIFLNPDYEDYLVAVYAIAGPFRSGKSFLLNLLIPHLRLLEVALFLMDTQGLFDLTASTEKMTTIGTLSFLMSSLQCFNVKEQIHRVHLEHIFKFAQMAKDVKEEDEENWLIEKGSLMFIVRDWLLEENDGYSYGFEGGKKYLKDVIEPKVGHAKEHQMMKEYRDQTFGEIPCCLLPFPGEAIRRKSVGSYGELNEDFQSNISQLIKKIASSQNLHLKHFDGKEVTCAEFCAHMEAFASMLKQNIEIEEVQSLIQTLRFETRETIKETLMSKNRTALRKYKEFRKCGGADFQRQWQNELENLLQQISDGIEACAVAEQQYVKLITEFNKWRMQAVANQCTSSDDFKQAAYDKRKDLLKKLKRTVSEDLYEQCQGYFRRDTNRLLAETENEVREYLEKLQLPIWQTLLLMGALIVTEEFLPFANDAVQRLAAEVTSKHQQKVRNQYLNSDQQSPTNKIALAKYEESEINVKLCFGKVTIVLESKVKLVD